MKIYLAGKVPKGDEVSDFKDWRDQFTHSLSYLSLFKFLTPLNEKLDYGNPLSVFGHDCLLIKEADLIIVDGSRKLGVGTAQEMVIAKYFNKYVFTILPINSHHRRPIKNFDKITLIENWVHPFIYSFSDKIFDDPESCINYLKENSDTLNSLEVKTISVIDQAIKIHLSEASQ